MEWKKFIPALIAFRFIFGTLHASEGVSLWKSFNLSAIGSSGISLGNRVVSTLFDWMRQELEMSRKLSRFFCRAFVFGALPIADNKSFPIDSKFLIRIPLLRDGSETIKSQLVEMINNDGPLLTTIFHSQFIIHNKRLMRRFLRTEFAT